ncbi:hypothetical protein AF72_11000 [Xylella taiwanensis]|uniref:Uncharacterized protein n=1 Tax=Xylella taiwanensis TaxID=1444770 RepID=Z9JG70_9GAMM|nr:hypothetical protein AF72_11000 [Xylella taiwanensis]
MLILVGRGTSTKCLLVDRGARSYVLNVMLSNRSKNQIDSPTTVTT